MAIARSPIWRCGSTQWAGLCENIAVTKFCWAREGQKLNQAWSRAVTGVPRLIEKPFGRVTPSWPWSELILSGQVFCDRSVESVASGRSLQRRLLLEHLFPALGGRGQVKLVQKFLEEVISQSRPAQDLFGCYLVKGIGAHCDGSFDSSSRQGRGIDSGTGNAASLMLLRMWGRILRDSELHHRRC